ncbi:hypothetical protein KBI33_01060 [Candidatus Shapirobacteria bacterium]|nr:hypothetical protein [Candidatus Shapirobacteria bacterium]
MKKEKILPLLLIFAIFFRFYLSYPGTAIAANSCSSVTVSPGRLGNNTLTIRSEQIVKEEEYQISIDGGGAIPNVDISEKAKEGKILEVIHNFTYIGDYKIKLEYSDGTNICEGDISIKPSTNCKWEITPDKPFKNTRIDVKVTNISDVIPQGDFQIKVAKPDNNEDRFEKNKSAVSLEPKLSGSYYFRLYSLAGGGATNYLACSIHVFVGPNAENPGYIGQPQIGGPDTEVYDICQGDEACSNCFSNGNAWTAFGCIPTDPMNLVKWLFPYLLGFGGLAVFGLIVFSGIQIIISSGDPQKIQGAKETITSAITGLIFVILSLFLLRLIGVDILGLPGLE